MARTGKIQITLDAKVLQTPLERIATEVTRDFEAQVLLAEVAAQLKTEPYTDEEREEARELILACNDSLSQQRRETIESMAAGLELLRVIDEELKNLP